MFRKEGYLNFSQICEVVMQEWSDDLDLFHESETPDFPTLEERRQTFVTWGFRTVVDAVTCVALINEKGLATEVDAWRVLWEESEKAPTAWIAEANFPKDISSSVLSDERRKHMSGWSFVNDSGLLTLPWRWSYLTQPRSARAEQRRLLLPYRGWTVAVKDADARSILEFVRGDGVARADKGKQGLAYIYNCFCEAFPDGKGSATWDDVQKRVGYSRRHIRRALETYGGHSAGQLDGQ